MGIIRILCIYSYFVEIIHFSWKYPHSVDIIHILSVLSLMFYSYSESDWCILTEFAEEIGRPAVITEDDWIFQVRE